MENYVYIAVSNDNKYYDIEQDWIPEGFLKDVSIVDNVEDASYFFYKSELEDLIKEYYDNDWLFKGASFNVKEIKKYRMITKFEEV